MVNLAGILLDFSPNKIYIKTDKDKIELFDYDKSFLISENKIEISLYYDLINYYFDKNSEKKLEQIFYSKNDNNKNLISWKCSDIAFETHKWDKIITLQTDDKILEKINSVRLYLDNEPIKFIERIDNAIVFELDSEVVKYFSEIYITIDYKENVTNFNTFPINRITISPEINKISSVSFNKYIKDTNISIGLKKWIKHALINKNFNLITGNNYDKLLKSSFNYFSTIKKIDHKFRLIIFIVSLIVCSYIFFLFDSLKSFFYDKKIITDIESGRDKEEKAISVRLEKFNHKYKNISKIPVIGYISKKIYSNIFGFISIVLLLIIFVSIKAPFFNNSFAGGSVAVKYNSYVEPAKYMAEKNNPFWYQAKYSSDPITNPNGIRGNFGNLVLLDWMLFLSYKIMPFNSIEVNTRLVMTLIGVLIIIFYFLF